LNAEYSAFGRIVKGLILSPNPRKQDRRLEFELQPHLSGTLIEIRPLHAEDFDALFEAASDPMIWEQHPEPDRFKREVFQRFFDGAIESRWSIQRRAEGADAPPCLSIRRSCRVRRR
jgi:RimJ/RimL family protein N-acetyltransferase